MPPRRYEMGARAETAAARRARVVEAAIELFAERTAAATSMEDVARASGVAPATVYRQFGDFDGLARACAETAFDIAEVPTPEAAVVHLAGLDGLAAKLWRFVQLSCECYARAERWLGAERRERHLPAFGRTVAREEAALDAIVTGLLEPAGVEAATRAIVTTLADFPFWQELRRRGVPPDQIPAVVFDQVSAALGAAGLPLTRPVEGSDS